MTIRIGTSERDGTFFSQGCALAAVLAQADPPVPATVMESNSASIENAQRLDLGEIDFGFMASNWIGRAKHGEPPFPHPIDLAMVAPMNAGPLFFVTLARSPIRSMADLRGRRIALGKRTSGMVQHAHVIFDVLDLDFTDFTPVYLDFADGAQALAAGEVDVQFQCPIPNKVMTDLAGRVALRVLPYAPAQLEAVTGAVPYYRRCVMRRDAIAGLDADVEQVAVVNVLVTHARVPEATVRAVADAVIAGSDELGRRNLLFAGLKDLFEPLRAHGAAALAFGGVPPHPGAVAAFRDAGLLT
jgi:TRAP transporter TAXI family solute receptor